MKTNRLSERAMLIHMSGHQWTGRKKDKAVTQNVCTLENADKDAGAWWTYLVPPKELQPINSAWGRCYRRFTELTLPWMDGGMRILPSAMYMEFRAEMQKLTIAYDEAVDEFIKRWPDIVQHSSKRLGKLGSGHRMPTTAELKGKFYIGQDILPVPEITDFRVELADEEAETIRTQVVSGIQAGITRSTTDLYARLSDLVVDVAETMNQPDKKFRNTIITKLKKFCEMMPKYNITDNAELNKLKDEVMAKLAALDPEDLREIPNHRKKAGKDAKDILAKISDYMK